MYIHYRNRRCCWYVKFGRRFAIFFFPTIARTRTFDYILCSGYVRFQRPLTLPHWMSDDTIPSSGIERPTLARMNDAVVPYVGRRCEPSSTNGGTTAVAVVTTTAVWGRRRERHTQRQQARTTRERERCLRLCLYACVCMLVSVSVNVMRTGRYVHGEPIAQYPI